MREVGPVVVATAEEMRAVGVRLARLLRGGDLVLLTGDLGAGKTTLASGIGAGLRVRGRVTSPTFVIAREHPPVEPDGVWLVHVDAYRLGGRLDLDSVLAQSVTLVEWGHDLAEGLADDRLEVFVERADTAPGLADDDPRTVRVVGYGDRWRQLAVTDVSGPAV
jgi:tRNA threonylcarbamoyladenosine biosynthesis protein TsaE